MAISVVVAQDLASLCLTYYVRGEAFLQTVKEKPLVGVLSKRKKTMPGGKDDISYPVQGAFMGDVSGFFKGYSEADELTFGQAQNALRVQYPWRQHHAGLMITETELLKDGISVNDHQKTSEHSKVELTRLTGILKNRLNDYGESWAQAFNNMCWADGSQDSAATPGITSLLTTDVDTGSVGGLSKVTYPWWRSRVALNITPSEQNQTLSKKLRSELRLLRRFQGGKPNIALAGSAFLEALESEVQQKGQYTQEGFAKMENDLGMNDLIMRGLGKFQYDPTLDDLGKSKYCYIFDDKHIIMSPIEGEENKLRVPERPYNYFVFIQSMTWAGAIGTNMLGCNGVYTVA